MKSLFAFAFAGLLLGLSAFSGCTLPGDSSDAGTDGPVSCGSQTCSTSQVCLARECTLEDRCKPSRTCPAGTTPTTCDGQPGCLYDCNPQVQGCRDIPTSCSDDVTCACGSICGSAAACAKVEGRNILCAAVE